MRQATQCRGLNQKLLGLVCAKLGQSAFGSMATMSIIADQDITVLNLESEFDTDESKDEDISADSDSDTDDTTDTDFTQWPVSSTVSCNTTITV
jgi:hypothetical protein